jgi:uncharacterized protein YbjT (DUF2867 family)
VADRPWPDPATAAGAGTILVTGATGTTGRRLARLLHRRGANVRAASRNPDRTTADSGAPVVFDWNDPATYPAALAGVARLYLLRPAAPAAEPLAIVERFLDAARSAGVRRVVLLHSTVTGTAGVPEIPQAVEQATPEWAILRPSWFMQNFTGNHPTAAAIRERGEIATATGDGKVAFIDADDIAAAAAETLLVADLPNTRYTLTGPEALSYPQIAAIISEAAGRRVRHINLTAGQVTARWAAAGLPSHLARIGAQLDISISRGEQDYTTSTVEDLTGRPPRSFRDYAHAHQAAWQISHPNDKPDRAPAPGG